MKAATTRTTSILPSAISKVLITFFSALLLISLVYFALHFSLGQKQELEELTDAEKEDENSRLITFGVIGGVSVVVMIVLGVILVRVGKVQSEESEKCDEKLPEAEDVLAKLLEESAVNPETTVNLLTSPLSEYSVVVCRHDLPNIMETCVFTSKESLETTQLAIFQCCKQGSSLIMNVGDVDSNPIQKPNLELAHCIDEAQSCPEGVLLMKSRRIEAFESLKGAEQTGTCTEDGTQEDHDYELTIGDGVSYYRCSSNHPYAAIYKILFFQTNNTTSKLGLLAECKVPKKLSLYYSPLLTDPMQLSRCSPAIKAYTNIIKKKYGSTALWQGPY
jgi:hypothetical protein